MTFHLLVKITYDDGTVYPRGEKGKGSDLGWDIEISVLSMLILKCKYKLTVNIQLEIPSRWHNL